MVDIEKLKELAEAATPGPWEHRFVEGEGTPGAICHEHGWVADDFTDQSFKDTAYIAAANPAAVLDLIAEIERRERLYRQLEKTLDRVHCMWAKRMLDATGQRQQVLIPDQEFVKYFEELKQLKAENEKLRKELEK